MSTKIPLGWSEVSLAALCTISSGGTPSKSEAAYWTGDIPWVSGKDMKAPRLRDAIDHISIEGLAAGSRLAPAGSVLLLVRGMGLARDLPVAVALRPMAFNQDIKALVPKQDGLGPFIRAAIYHRRALLLSRIVPSAHGTMTLNLDDIETFAIPMPAQICEARAIGSAIDLVLNGLDQAIRQLAVVEQLRRVVMDSLFARGLEREPQKETAIGPVPAGWSVTTLDEICSGNSGSIQTGPFGSQLHAHEYQVEGTPVINPTHLAGNRIEHTNVPRVDEETARRLERHRVERGDILFGRRGQIGRHGLVTDAETGWLCGTGCFLVRARDPRVDNAFLSYLFATERAVGWLEAHATGTIMPNLNSLVLGRFPVAYPGIAEQRDIVAILEGVDRKISLHRRKHAVFTSLFNSLLHKLMTGEILLVDLDLSALESSGRSLVAL